MLGLKAGVRIWYVSVITNMRYGKYRLFSEVEAAGGNPYYGDANCFMSKNHRMVKIIRYASHKRYVYDITFYSGYKFMKVLTEGGKTLCECDYKHIEALLQCPVIAHIKTVINTLNINKIMKLKFVSLAFFSYLFTMKKDYQIVDELLENAKYLQALNDIKPKSAVLSSDSQYQDLLDQLKEKDALIESLKISLDGMKTSLDTLILTVRDLNKTNRSSQEQNAKLLALVEALTKELDTYKALMGRSSQETFGSKSLSRKHKATTKKSRSEGKEDWTSKDDDKKNPPSAPGISTEGVNPEKVTSVNLSSQSARPFKYNRMNAAKVVYIETTLDTAPENMTFKGYREVEES